MTSDFAQQYEQELRLERLRREVFSRLLEPGLEERLAELLVAEREAGERTRALVPRDLRIPKATLIDMKPGQSAEDQTLGPETTGLTVQALLRMSHIPTGIVHLLNPEDEPLVSFQIHVLPGRNFARLRLTSYVEGYSAHAVDTLELFGDKKEATLVQFPTFFPERLRTLTEQTRATLHIQIEDLAGDAPGGMPRLELHRSFPLWLLPQTTARLAVIDPTTGKALDMTRYFAAWVTPNAQEVLSVLRKAADRAKDVGGIVGYQAGSDGVLAQARALFLALSAESLTYVNTIFARGGDGTHCLQRVRLPRESLGSRSANCLDGTVLFASLLEAASLFAGIALVPGHAFVAWKQSPDPSKDDWDFLETTLLASGDFERARERGRWLASQYADRMRLLSVPELRQQGIVPME
jgi:hypothetical protein